jgi:hypothetical protein
LLEQLERGCTPCVLAEEWHTVDTVLHLGFQRIDWRRLSAAARITTVSRYMRQLMAPLGVPDRDPERSAA